jgi:hypothetical protein
VKWITPKPEEGTAPLTNSSTALYPYEPHSVELSDHFAHRRKDNAEYRAFITWKNRSGDKFEGFFLAAEEDLSAIARGRHDFADRGDSEVTRLLTGILQDVRGMRQDGQAKNQELGRSLRRLR